MKEPYPSQPERVSASDALEAERAELWRQNRDKAGTITVLQATNDILRDRITALEQALENLIDQSDHAMRLEGGEGYGAVDDARAALNGGPSR